MNARELFDIKKRECGDIAEHMETLARYASKCDVVVEFGVRAGGSTSAFIFGGASLLVSYDWAVPKELDVFARTATMAGARHVFFQADTSKLESIPECDLLFIDTLHTKNQVAAELKHAHRARKFVIFHDTEIFGMAGENGEPGICFAMQEYLDTHPEWKQVEHYAFNNGLTVWGRV